MCWMPCRRPGCSSGGGPGSGGPVIPHRGTGVGVTGGDLHVAQVSAGVEHGRDIGYLYCLGLCELREFSGVTRRCLRNIRYFEARQLRWHVTSETHSVPSGRFLPSMDPSCGWCWTLSWSRTGRPATSCGRCTGRAVRRTRSGPMPGGWRASWAGARARVWSGRRSAWRSLARFKHFVEATPGRGGRLRSGTTVNATLTAVCEFLRFCARTGVIEQAVADRLSEPRWLRFTPPGFDAGESGQFRTVRARMLKARAETPFPEAFTGEQAATGHGVLPAAAGTLHGDAAAGRRAADRGGARAAPV